MQSVCQTPRNILGTTPLNSPLGPCSLTTIRKIPRIDKWDWPALALAWASIRASSIFLIVFFVVLSFGRRRGTQREVRSFFRFCWRRFSSLISFFFCLNSHSLSLSPTHRWGGSSMPALLRRFRPRPPAVSSALPWGRCKIIYRFATEPTL